MNISCVVPTKHIENIASRLGKTVNFTRTLVSAWQSLNPGLTPEYEDIKEYYDSRVPSHKDLTRISQNNNYAKLNRDYSPTLRHDRASNIARMFSDIVNREVENKLAEIDSALSETDNPEELSRLLEKKREYNSYKGRHAAIRDITLTNIIKEIQDSYEEVLSTPKEELAKTYGEDKVDYIINEYQKILDNFPALFDEACPIIEASESLRIVTDYHTFNDGKNESVTLGGDVYEDTQENDADNDASNDVEGTERATGNDGWNYKVRFTDPYSTLSKDVKKVLSSIIKVDSKGKVDVDDLGNTRYLNPEYTHVVLLNELSGMIDADDFMSEDGRFPALEKASAKYPWIKQVINALVIDENLRGSFFADLRKDFIPYWKQLTDKDGKQITKSLNTITSSESMFNTIESNYVERNILDDDSIYTKAGKIASDKAVKGEKLCNETMIRLKDFGPKDFDIIVNNVAKMLNMVGIEANESYIKDLLKSQSGISDLNSILYELKNIFVDSQKVDAETDLIEQFKDNYKNITDKIGTIDEFESIASFRDGDKTRYSYSTPNYIDTTIKKLKSDERRQAFLDEEFGAYAWFKNPKNGKWRSEWLRLIAGEDDDIKEISDDVRQHLSTKEVISIGDKPYTDWRPEDIKKAFINEYFSIPKNRNSKVQYAWYNMPIFSDSPVVKFIRYVKYTSDSEGTFKQKLLPKLRNVVKQELYRIRLVNDRRKAGVEPIQNFDKNGDRFHFFPELNNGDFLDRAIKLSDDKNVTELNALIDGALNEVMDNLFANFMLSSDISSDDIASMLVKNGAIKNKSEVGDALEEYFWNQVFASTQIIELTTTDLAFYKDAVDFQKRYKEVYASGTKLNTNTKYGKKFRNTLYIADDIITSSVYNDIKETLNNAVQKGLIKSYDRDNILDKFKNVNVADAQAYVSPEAMRSILDMSGKWTEEMQAAYDRFEAGEFDMTDFNIVWQTIKPFVFTQLRKPDGLGGIIKVPHQNKNSEYLLLAAYGMIANSLNKSPQLKALQKYMTDNKIDVIQFQSAVKDGGQGIIDVNYSESKLEKALKPEILKAAEAELGNKFATASDIEKFKAGADRMLETGKITQDSYNTLMESVLPTEDDVYNTLDKYAKENGEFKPEYLHTISYNDYMIQQPVPEHLVDTEAIFGSQLRNLIIADLPEDFNTVVNGKKLNRKELIDLYDSLIVENLLENFSRIRGQVENIYTLQEVLLNQVKGNVKYSRDMVNALQIIDVVNPISGEIEKAFNIPLSNPIVTLEFQKLVTSLFKNGVTKQYIKGGNAVQVSDYGLTDELKIRRDKNGKLLGFECYLPATSMQFFKFFMTEDKNGNQVLDIKKLHKAGLDKIVGYRIPTEDKYSMAPLIIKGFLPQQNGSAIMLPSEITTMAGSDFDIDKMFLMLPEFRVSEYDYETAKKWYEKTMKDKASLKLINKLFGDSTDFEEAMKDVETPEAFKNWWKDNKELYRRTTPIIEKINYNFNKATKDNIRAQRNNMLIDIIFNVLTNESVEDKLFNPGGYDGVKVQARISNIINNENIYRYFLEKYGFDNRKDAIDYLLKLSRESNLDELDSFIKEYNKIFNTERNSLTPDTFIYNHKQNMTGGALVGMYANNNSAQAKYQHSNLSLKNAYSFMLNGRRIKSLHDVTSELGERISRNCSQMLAASVDNVKDPVLADLMQNQNTAKIMGFMLRAGMSLEEASLMFSQPIVKNIFNQFGFITNKTLKKAIKSATKFLASKGGTSYLTNVPDFDSKLLMNNILVSYDVDNLTDNEKNMALAYQIKAAELMLNIVNCANELSMITQISRADSPNGGILNTIGGAKVQVAKVDDLHVRASENAYPFEGIEDVIDNNKVTLRMSDDELRDKLLNTKMSKLQAFYSLGIELGSKVFNRFFPQVNRYSDAILSQFVEDTFGAYLSNTNVAVEHFNLIYKDLVNFALSGTKMFGDEETLTVDNQANTPNSYEGLITPDNNTIFVFGSNPEGRHGAGAAKTAREKFGAVYGQDEGLQGNSYALPTKRIKQITPTKTGQMTFSYGENKRPDIQSSTTFEAIINGERTATTRYTSDGNIDYWKDLKIGDIVAFKSAGNKGIVYVKITKPLTQLQSNTNAEEWSKKEGWSVEYYNNKVRPKVDAGQAYQMEYEFVDANGERTITPQQITENIRKMYEVANQNPNKLFKVAYTNGLNEVTLNGYTGAEMIKMFKDAGPIPSNVVFSKNWTDHWNKVGSTQQQASQQQHMGMTYAEKRDYYVNKFPDKFMEIKRNNPDIAKLGIIKKLNVFDGNIVFEKSGRLRQQTKDSFMRDMDTLLYMNNTSRALAEDLIKYAYYTNGLWFSPNGFSNFFSSNFLNSFPEIVDTMRNLSTTMSDPKYSRFLSQFYANHDKIAEAFIEIQSPQFNDEKQAVVPIDKVLNYLGNPVRFIKINKTKYELVNFDDGYAQYAPAPKFTDLRYNMNMEAFEMEGFNDKVKKEKVDFNSFPEDIEGLVSDAFEGAMGMLESGFEGVEGIVNPIEKYTEDEGENTLNEPLCKN